MKTTGYCFDAMNATLKISKAFAEKASRLGSPEYRIILQFRRDYPDLKISELPTQNSHSGIKFKQMENFIAQCRDSENRLAMFEKIKTLSKIQSSPYAYVKEWFLNNYANYSEQPEFDEDHFVIVKTKAEMEAEAKVATREKTDEAKAKQANNGEEVAQNAA